VSIFAQNRVIREVLITFTRGRKVTSLGVIFNFTGNAPNTIVQPVANMINEAWVRYLLEWSVTIIDLCRTVQGSDCRRAGLFLAFWVRLASVELVRAALKRLFRHMPVQQDNCMSIWELNSSSVLNSLKGLWSSTQSVLSMPRHLFSSLEVSILSVPIATFFSKFTGHTHIRDCGKQCRRRYFQVFIKICSSIGWPFYESRIWKIHGNSR
jgi:hypothetical protein